MRGERRLPVFDTAHDIFAFTWRKFATIMRLSWCPLLLASLAGYFATRTATVIATVFLAIAAWAVVAPALHRVALFGDRQPGTFLNLRFGKVEALFALPPFLYAAVIITLQILGVPLEWHFNGGGPAIAMMCVIAVVIFLAARFCLIFPIAVMQGRFNVAQAWSLSSGYAWRMLCLSIVVTTPAFIVAGAWQWLLLTVLKVTPAAMTAEQFDGSLLELPALTWPISIVLGALCVGILSYSYKSLAGFAPDAELKPVA